MLEGKKVKFVVQKLIIDSGRNSNNSLTTCILNLTPYNTVCYKIVIF